MSEQVVSLVLAVQERLLVPLLPHPAEAGHARHAPQGAGLDVPSQPDDIQHNEQGDSQQAQPDNVVRVEVPGGHSVAVVHPMVDVLLLSIPSHGPGNYNPTIVSNKTLTNRRT